MMDLNDALALEGEGAEGSLQEYVVALQRSLNSGMAWMGPGRMGRAAMDGLEDGLVMLPEGAMRDYYGKKVPGRGELVPGSKGTRELVVARYGEEWAEMLEEEA